MRATMGRIASRSLWPQNSIGIIALVGVDERSDYGEIRIIALAPATGILYAVA